MAVLAAALLAPSPARGAEPVTRLELSVTCPFEGRDTRLKNMAWIPLVVTLAYKDGAGPVFRGAVILEKANDHERTRIEVDVPRGTVKRMTALLWIRSRDYAVSCQASLVDEDGRVVLPPFSVPLDNLEFEDFNSLEGGVLRMALYEKEFRLARVFLGAEITGVTSVPSGVFFRHWSAYSSLDAVIINAMDLGALEEPQIAALEGWVASGGLLILGPGDDPAFYRTRLVRRFFPVQCPGSHTQAGFSLFPDMPVEGSFLVHRLSSSGKTWEDLWRRQPFGFGAVVLLRTPLAFLQSLEPDDCETVCYSLFERPANATSCPLGDVFQGIGAMERGNYSEEEDELSALSSSNDFLALFLRNVTTLPSTALLALFFILYIALVGPVNFVLLRRRGRHALLLVTVPVVAVTAILFVVVMGYLVQGREVRASRIDLVHLPHGQGRGLRTELLAFRSTGDGPHSLFLGEDLAPLLMFDKVNAPRMMDQTHGFVVKDLFLRQWDVAVASAVEPVHWGEGLSLLDGPRRFRLRNDTDRDLGPGLFAWGGVLAEIPVVEAGRTASFQTEPFHSPSDQHHWKQTHPHVDPLFFPLHQLIYSNTYIYDPAWALLVLTVPPDPDKTLVNDRTVELGTHRTLLLLRPPFKGGPPDD
jgi:hypothetical protein